MATIKIKQSNTANIAPTAVQLAVGELAVNTADAKLYTKHSDGTVKSIGPDGITWTARTAAEANGWYGVTYGNGLFVAVANSGTNRVMTSPDGITWTARTAAEANGWVSVTYGNGLFVAVAYSGTNRVMTSPDGITWTARSAAEASGWYGVTYGNGLFVAVAYSGTNRVMTSPDGITWTARTAAEANSWISVTYGNGLFVAVADSGTNRVMTSPDGITWTARTAAEANSWISVTYGNGLFVAVAYSTNRVMTSPDGITWTARSAAEASGWYGVTYGNGLFVAVAQSGTNRVMTSPDGITWTARSVAENNSWLRVTYGNGLFVAVANSGTNRVMTFGSLFESSAQVNDDIRKGNFPAVKSLGLTITSPYSGLTTIDCNSNTVMILGQVIIPYRIVANYISLNVTAVTVAGTVQITLYSEDGQRQIFSITTATISSTGALKVALSSILIHPGIYYLAVNANNTTNVSFSSWNTNTVSDPLNGVSGLATKEGWYSITANTPPSTITVNSITIGPNRTVLARLDT